MIWPTNTPHHRIAGTSKRRWPDKKHKKVEREMKILLRETGFEMHR
jgi:hypothetical protein